MVGWTKERSPYEQTEFDTETRYRQGDEDRAIRGYQAIED